MPSAAIHDLTKAIAEVFELSFIASSSGSLKPEERPYPWLSFFPARIREKPEKFLLLLAILGEWNRKNPDAQWIYRPEEAANQTLFTGYCLLETLERNDSRDPGVLERLRESTKQLARYLNDSQRLQPPVEEGRLEFCYPNPASEGGPIDDLGPEPDYAYPDAVEGRIL